MRIARQVTSLAAAITITAGLAACATAVRTPPGSRGSSPAADPSHAAASQAAASPSPGLPAMQTVREASAPQHVRAKGAAIANLSTMQLLWSRELDSERPIGSITKVMTALVVMRAGDLNREIRIPKSVLAYVAKYQAESAGLHPGDVLSTRQLLEAMLLQSACDAAYVLAVTYGPGMTAFLAKMNATAKQLGLAHTHFTSPDGLPYPTEYSTYSTPADLITLGIAAMKYSLFRSIVSQRFYQVRKIKNHNRAYWWGNTNDLIGNYQGADGIKTGYTDDAGHCLLFEAVRHRTTLIGVVLGSPPTGPDAAAQAAISMLNWGFDLKPAPGT